MVCMAASTAFGNVILLSPSVQLPNSDGKHVSPLRLQEAVKWNVGEKSTRLFTSTIFRRKARRAPSRSVRNGAADAESNADLEENPEGYSSKQSAMLHRREIVWAATGAFSYLSSGGIVQSAAGADGAAPVPPTNMASADCRTVEISGPVKTQSCCQPDGSKLKPKKFKFETLPMRIRKPAHILSKDKDYVKKYNSAYSKMIALPPDDPRSFGNQWRIHCSFCNGVYPEPGNNAGLSLQYHGSWTFLPWHRMYLYFHERILGELIGDPKFALPFWNWDNQRRDDGGNQMPLMFSEDWGILNDHLRCAIRDIAHYPPTYVTLGDPDPLETEYEKIQSDNLSILHTAVVSTTSPIAFLGGPYRPKQPAWPDAPGSCESDGHNIVHAWTGGKTTPNNEDMGTFIYAARDPIFYTHHSNVDRLWSVWQSLDASSDETTRGGQRARKEPTDSGFLNTTFAFYDHKKELIHVKVADTLDRLKLSFRYQVMDSDQDWINFQKRASGAPKPSQAEIEPFARRVPVIFKDQSSSFRLVRRKPTDVDVEGLTADEVEETLLVTGAQLPMSSFSLFKVFINLPTADARTPLDIQEFAGLISHIPHAMTTADPEGSSMPTGGYTLRLSIGSVLKSLSIPDEESVSVTFVPGTGQSEDVTFENLTIDFN